MAGFNNNQGNPAANGADFTKMQELGEFNIKPIQGAINFIGDSRFEEMEMDDSQKMQLNSFVQQIPSLVVADKLAKSYTISFPKGLPHTLMKLKAGGLGTPIIGGNGNIVGMASLCSSALEGMIFGAFSIMSVLTGQFFLFFIKRELTKINHHLQNVEQFLYGDKKAELIAETLFTQYATDNYASIMYHGEQRSATISSLQQSQKIAIKDIEFYICDLDSTVDSKFKNGKPKTKNDTIADCKHSCDIIMGNPD